MTELELNNLKNVDVQTCDENDLVDIRDIFIDTNKSKVERVIEYMESLKNPYLFKVGDVVVKVEFGNSGNTLQSCIEHIIENKTIENDKMIV